MPELARQVLELLAVQLDEVGQRIAEVNARIMAWHKAHSVSRRLVTIPGIGPLIATAITTPGMAASSRPAHFLTR